MTGWPSDTDRVWACLEQLMGEMKETIKARWRKISLFGLGYRLTLFFSSNSAILMVAFLLLSADTFDFTSCSSYAKDFF